MKNRILKALTNFRQIDSLDFTQEFDGSRLTTNTQSFEVEDYGLSISFSIVETVRWDSHEWNQFEDYDLEYIQSWDINGDEINLDNISEEEILNALGC